MNSGSSGEIIGYNGAGYFTQSGGTNSSTASSSTGLTLGYQANSSGTYTLNSGSPARGSGLAEYLGYYGASASGSFIRNGGSNTIVNGNSLYLAYGSNSTGDCALAAGSLSAATEYIGYAGTGTFPTRLPAPRPYRRSPRLVTIAESVSPNAIELPARSIAQFESCRPPLAERIWER